MKAVYDACEAARIKIPLEVSNYFQYTEPDEFGEELDVNCEVYYKEEYGQIHEGYTIDINKLSKDIVKLRVYYSY